MPLLHNQIDWEKAEQKNVRQEQVLLCRIPIREGFRNPGKSSVRRIPPNFLKENGCTAPSLNGPNHVADPTILVHVTLLLLNLVPIGHFLSRCCSCDLATDDSLALTDR